jgi:Protein of unknown function (DUF1592)/Protein of unknown function (DUF1588)/Protein of unknown function (DUF1587)/Protein of unknown function (DUF1595)/Protein of unknown function (DUF1585)
VKYAAATAMLLAGCVGSISPGDPTQSATSDSAGSPAAPGHPAPPGAADPGRVALRRLNRTEYDNTVRDLLGTTLRPAQGFAADPTALGFDNNGDVQSLTAIQLEQYQNAGEALADEALAGGPAHVAVLAHASACDPAARACVQALIAAFARRAWRRPPAADELARLMAVPDAEAARGGDGVAQLRVALIAVLTSPHFLFRLEPVAQPGGTRALDDHEVASRLSYLIYSSLPDDPLFQAADAGQLRTAADVRAQATRMLGDPRGAAFVSGFATQWLGLVDLEQHDVDPALFSGFDPALAAAMKAETQRFFADFLAADRPAQELLVTRATVADPRLAQLYGDSARPGLLTQASVLTATSSANATNPVTRGAWVVSQLFCTPPPPPPPKVPNLPEASATGRTLRARLEAHRANPVCASCHQLFDPIGLGLENYDAVGRWRTTDAGEPIDASGDLPDGTHFAGPAELIAALGKDPRLPGCVAQKLFTYALGRAPDGVPTDAANLARLSAAAGGARAGIRSLVLALVESDAFRLRREEP